MAMNITSLQCHLNRQFARTPFVRTEDMRHRNVELTAAEVSAMQCAICDRHADFFMNLCGRELLLCPAHAEQASERYAANDPITWFLRPIVSDIEGEPARHYIFVMKVPAEWNSKYCGIPWLWYPETATRTFRIYSTNAANAANTTNTKGLMQCPITEREIRQLMYQLSEEQKQNRSAFVIGFANKHPFERPDLAQGYSLGIHKCTDCSAEHFESYHFKYAADLPPIDEKMLQSSFEFDPETFSFSAS